MYSNEIEVKEEKSSITFQNVLSDFSNDLELKKQLAEASILIIPHRMKYEGKTSIFPVGTVELYHHLLENSPENVMINIATRDDEYLELAQHSALIELATIIAYTSVTTILLNLISSYIYDAIRQEGSRVKSEIIIVNRDGSSTSIKYNGPAKEYYNTLSEVLKNR
jgi:hypothetical protein